MATTVTKTIKSSGGDYTSLSAWEAGQQGDLVTADEIRQAECYFFEDTTPTVIDGSTTDATRYLRVFGVASDKTASNTGKWSTERYRLVCSTGIGLYNNDPYTIIDDIQISVSGGNFYYALQSNSGPCYVNSSIFRATATVQYLVTCTSSGAFTMRNCLVYDSVRYGISLQGSGTQTLQNVTVANCPRNGIQRTSGTAVITNCIGHNNGDGVTYFDFFGIMTATYCASKDASADDNGGAGNRISQTFTFVDATNKDFHLASTDAGAINFGTDLSASFTTDIDGVTRSTSWDIGADEYVAVGGGSVTPTLMLMGMGV